MRLKGSLKKEDHLKLKKEEQDHYELLEGTDFYVLKEGETENVDGLKSALSHEKDQSSARQKALDALKDVDPDKYHKLVKEEADLVKQKEEVSKQLTANNAQWETKLEKATKKSDTRAAALYSALEEALIDRTLLSAAGTKVLTPKIWLRAAKDHVKLIEEKGENDTLKFRVEVIDPDTKAPRISEKSKGPMSTEELVDHLGTLEDFKPLYKASGAAGSGAGAHRTTPPGSGGPGVISREDARDPAKYRAAREESLKSGQGLPVIESPAEPIIPSRSA